MKQIFIILLFAVFSVKCYADNSENVVDTTKYIFILDDKVITAKYMFDHWNEIEWVTTATTVREAVFTTAGEYRTPFTCFAPVKRREETNENNNNFNDASFPFILVYSQGKYHINGILNNDYNGKYVKLFQFQGDTLITSIDSAKVQRGEFFLKVQLMLMNLLLLLLESILM